MKLQSAQKEEDEEEYYNDEDYEDQEAEVKDHVPVSNDGVTP
jgi:hypothetical protein